MLSQKNIQKNLDFLQDLVQRKGWQIDWNQVNKALKKPQPRFFYFPLTDSDGEKLFFKSCLFGKSRLCRRAIKEYKIQKWLGSIDGPVKKIKDFGQKGPVFWYTSIDFPLDIGFICREEDVSLIKPEDVSHLASHVRWLWQIKKETVPPDLLAYLLPRTTDGKVFPKAYRKIRHKYLKTLRGAFKVSKLDWQKEDEAKVLSFFGALEKEILSFEGGKGIFVHGDLAPNNIFFSPKKIIIFDWESAWWCNNLLLGLGADLANFYTRCWQRPELGEKLLEEMQKSPWTKKPFYPTALKIGLVISVLQKISPMFKFGVYQKTYDCQHFNWLVKILRENI